MGSQRNKAWSSRPDIFPHGVTNSDTDATEIKKGAEAPFGFIAIS
jgi:hypothetical protein